MVSLERFRAKWIPVRVKKTRQTESSDLPFHAGLHHLSTAAAFADTAELYDTLLTIGPFGVADATLLAEIASAHPLTTPPPVIMPARPMPGPPPPPLCSMQARRSGPAGMARQFWAKALVDIDNPKRSAPMNFMIDLSC
jgi:hypothetical protein